MIRPDRPAAGGSALQVRLTWFTRDPLASNGGPPVRRADQLISESETFSTRDWRGVCCHWTRIGLW